MKQLALGALTSSSGRLFRSAKALFERGECLIFELNRHIEGFCIDIHTERFYLERYTVAFDFDRHTEGFYLVKLGEGLKLTDGHVEGFHLRRRTEGFYLDRHTVRYHVHW